MFGFSLGGIVNTSSLYGLNRKMTVNTTDIAIKVKLLGSVNKKKSFGWLNMKKYAGVIIEINNDIKYKLSGISLFICFFGV